MTLRRQSIAAIALVAIVAGCALSADGAGSARLSAVPSTVAPGATVRIDGTGFTAGSSGKLLFDGSASIVPTWQAGNSGAFSVTFSLAGGTALGAHTVAAQATVAGSKKLKVLASTTVTVARPKPTPDPTPTPTQAPTPWPTQAATASPSLSPLVAPTATPAGEVILVAGDVASCSSSGDEATAALLGVNAGTIVIPGDIAYENGSTANFNDCFNPSWGLYKSRMKPAPGNHEYNTTGATGYYGYFGPAAGDPTKGYYAWDLGGWRLYALNSNCGAIGGCGVGSAQEVWLRADLAANPRTCVVAYWHHPRFSSGVHGSSTATQALWQALYDFNAEVVLVGHDHHYERFAPQTAAGVVDQTRGLRSFVVGTGGRSHYPLPGLPLANSRAWSADTFGLLKMALSANGYSWQFLPEAGKTFSDTGSGNCH